MYVILILTFFSDFEFVNISINSHLHNEVTFNIEIHVHTNYVIFMFCILFVALFTNSHILLQFSLKQKRFDLSNNGIFCMAQ